MTISTTATLSTLRPKVMAELYSSEITYLHRKDDVFHLLWGLISSPEVTERFGEAEAYFNPFQRHWYTWDGLPLTHKGITTLVSVGKVCMLGKDCPMHR